MIENREAFDHVRLLPKLETIGFKGEIILTQCVNVDRATSKWTEVMSGIPQGSVLGRLFFVIFINDMSVKFNICKLFADGCKLYIIVNTSTENKVQMDLS